MTDQLDSLYDPGADAVDSETPTFAELIFTAIRTKQLGLHVSFPAQITQLQGTDIVSIQPMLMKKYYDGKVVPMPIIQDIPVMFPRGAGYSIRYPIAVGDTGLAVVSERSLAVWKVSGGIVDPDDPRLHDLSDAVFYPGLYPESDPIPATNEDAIELTNGDATISINPDGTFAINGMVKTGGTPLVPPGKAEALNLIYLALKALATSTFVTTGSSTTQTGSVDGTGALVLPYVNALKDMIG